MKPSFVKTPIGNFLAHFKDRYLIKLELVNSDKKLFLDQNLQETINQLTKGKISVNELPLNINKLEGTEFQKKVWNEIKKIPYGETRSYKEVALAIGHPQSIRAVANACAKNPYAPIVPCHRVVRSDGNLGGYSAKGGIKKKAELLRIESQNVRKR